ncbi:67 kDa myosin-cross-reactive antigen family protein [Globomyces pollinis-pini]|nr:67 kDa myosin-cross-reactive antigen family protein [Globomyces pollinis-pini]
MTKESPKAYLVGGGIASLSAAFYLIKEGFVASNIHILERLKVTGGSMDASGNERDGFLMRGGRMFDLEAYTALWDMLDQIPSVQRPGNTVKQDIFEFSKEHPTSSRARLINSEHEKVDVTHLGVSVKDNVLFTKLLVTPESAIEMLKISEYFTEDFFESNFWKIFCTTFAFQPWHSLIEMKRYMKRFLHEVAKLSDLSGVYRTIFNQYDSIIMPVTKYLLEKNVVFEHDVVVTGIDFSWSPAGRTVDKIELKRGGVPEIITLESSDFCFTTLGSLTAAATIGTSTAPPKVNFESAANCPSYNLWKDISKKGPDFGNPDAFYCSPLKSGFESFSVTIKDNGKFLERMIEWSRNRDGEGALVTLRDSSWFMSCVIPHQPHFKNQPDDVTVFWGYGLKVDSVGDFVKKPMMECSGLEILQELLYHLKFDDILESTLASAIVLPAMLPFTMAQFMPRKVTDRPKVVPEGSINFAFLGQFVEVPDDVVFTVEYSVRCAQIAVFHLMKSETKVTPIYQGWLSPVNLVKSARAILLP